MQTSVSPSINTNIISEPDFIPPSGISDVGIVLSTLKDPDTSSKFYTKFQGSKKIANMLAQRTLNPGMLNTGSVDRILFRNHLFIPFFNKNVIYKIQGSIPKIENMMENIAEGIVGIAEHDKKQTIGEMITSTVFNRTNLIFNDIKNIPFENDTLFELFNIYINIKSRKYFYCRIIRGFMVNIKRYCENIIIF